MLLKGKGIRMGGENENKRGFFKIGNKLHELQHSQSCLYTAGIWEDKELNGW